MGSSTRRGSFCFGRWHVRSYTLHRIQLLLVVAASSFLLGPVGTAYGQVKPTNPGAAILPGPKVKLPPRVERFCRDAVTFVPSADAPGKQAKDFATNLCAAISANTPMAPVTANDLSPEAAKKLANHFHEDIAATMAYKEVVAPTDILKTFMQAVRGEIAWQRFSLVAKHKLIKKPLKDAPEVIVTVANGDELAKTLTESAPKAKTTGQLKHAYKEAYLGHKGWFKAIEKYFEEEEE